MAPQVNPKIIAGAGQSFEDTLAQALAIAGAPACRHAWVRRFDACAMATARSLDVLHAAAQPLGPLAGWTLSVKDLFDVAGHPTTAGSRVLARAAPAPADSPAVARLRSAGALLMGHTNLSEFAFSGVGINPYLGTPINAAIPGSTACIPGGSTSGGAVTVATGACRAALGSDTGGSIRIPAALQGLVGFKGTQRRVPRTGVIPLSTTLDTVGAITRDAYDARLIDAVLCAMEPAPPGMRSPFTLRSSRLAVPSTLVLDDLEPEVASAFDAALGALSRAGACIVEIKLPQLARLAEWQALGTFAAAESWAWHRQHLATQRADYDPRVALRIERGAQMSAADYIELHEARRRWIAEIESATTHFDALLCPTVPVLAPPLAPLLSDDVAFFRVNALLLRNPSIVNMLDGCAVSLPCHPSGTAPVGLMMWAAAGADARLLDLAEGAEAALAPGRGMVDGAAAP